MLHLQVCEDRVFWDQNLLALGGHPFQLWGWGEVKATNGWSVVRLYATKKNGDIAGMSQLLIRPLPWPLRSLAYMPRGPLVDKKDIKTFLDVVGDYVKAQYRSVVITIEPHMFGTLNISGWKRSSSTNFPDTTMLLDLTKSDEQLLQEMAKKTRQSVRKAERTVTDIRRIEDAKGLSECLKIYKQTAKRANFALHSDEYYRSVHKELGPNSIIYGAYIENELVGFLWLAVSKQVAYQMYSGINQQGGRSRANYILRWRAMQEMRAEGVKEYDFGGIIKGGVEEFKRGWSKEMTDFVGTYDKPLSPPYILLAVGLPVVKKLTQLAKRLKRALTR